MDKMFKRRWRSAWGRGCSRGWIPKHIWDANKFSSDPNSPRHPNNLAGCVATQVLLSLSQPVVVAALLHQSIIDLTLDIS